MCISKIPLNIKCWILLIDMKLCKYTTLCAVSLRFCWWCGFIFCPDCFVLRYWYFNIAIKSFLRRLKWKQSLDCKQLLHMECTKLLNDLTWHVLYSKYKSWSHITFFSDTVSLTYDVIMLCVCCLLWYFFHLYLHYSIP